MPHSAVVRQLSYGQRHSQRVKLAESPIMRDIVRSIRAICMQHHILLWPVHIAGKLNVTADGLSRGIVSARSDGWSLNTAIMNRWRATVGGKFDVDAFADPSGRGAQATRFHSAIDPPFGRKFFNLNVFAFPPLELVGSFLSDVVNWQAASVIAVLPLKANQGFKGNATFCMLMALTSAFFSAEAAKI
jgi:hypothetical protein